MVSTFCRKFGLGLGIVIIGINLTVSQIILMIKKPTLPDDQHNNQELFNMAVKLGLLGCLIPLFGGAAAMIQASHVDRFEIYLVVMLLFSFVIHLGLPSLYIVSVPNLKNYTVNFFEQNVFDPLVESLATLNHFVTFISPSPRVEPIYDINV